MSWSNERIELLQKLWLEGWSASRIAAELGDGTTRNAVIGKVFRLGLSGRSGNAGHGNPPAANHKQARRTVHRHSGGPQIVGNTALVMHPLAIEVPLPRQAREVVVPIADPVTILDLSESMCRWPIGDPAQSDFRYCGAKKIPGQGPYCACHSAIAFHNPQHERRRQKVPQE
jgi:GcrA cell cycle regulator